MKPRHLSAVAVAIASLSLGATQHVYANAPSAALSSSAQSMTAVQSESQKLNQLLERFFADSLARSPVYATFVGVHQYNDQFGEPLSDQWLADELAFQQGYLDAIKAIDGTQLTGQDWLSYEIFKHAREQAIKGFEFESYVMPISQMGGAHSWFAMLGSGSSAQPFNNEQDYRNFMQRAKGFADYMDSTIWAMKRGIEKGIVLPRPIVEKLLPQLSAHIVDDITQSVFYGPVAALDEKDGISADAKAELSTQYQAMIKEVIIPAYQRVHSFVQDEYLAKARETVGLSALPNGQARYAHQIDINTTLPLSAEEIHAFGQREVARILSEMRSVKETVGFEGDLPAFFEFLRNDDQFYFDSEQAVIDAYTDIKHKIDARVPTLFEVFPKADYEVRAVEAYRAASAAGASYQPPAPDGSRPGIFYINTHNLKAQPKFLMETLSVHEAAPGHHFQIAIQQEVEGLPAFRKFGGYTVFAEGWALYAESLGKEMGLFTDPYMWYGRLADEQLRAMRLVVDTGLHAMGWSRQKAIDFMLANSSMAESDVVAEVERYISIPGQALAYKTGERHIKMLRSKAKKALGEKFDIRKFHTQILIDGALPMPVLEAKIDKWIAQQQQA
ncbi:DUF885 domain-containing protein [Aestuariibacter salexigens]|uniref:DUF885 domain-containing protein n=1 Tax=Aestuariibacter salexigens TaxID=226010 RepID=UPI00041D192B|nr:DUF885 domain-containing protein [Aestuariibacter salexigens]